MTRPEPINLGAPSHVTDELARAAERPLFRSDAETAIREIIEEWLRQRYPSGRIIHELNMCQGGARIDMMSVAPSAIVGVEIKGPWDNGDRLITQLAAFRCVTTELWLVVAGRNVEVAGLARYLFPSIGIIEIEHAALPGRSLENLYREAWGSNSRPVDRDQLSLKIVEQAAPRDPFAASLKAMMWVEELDRIARQARLTQGKGKGTHRSLTSLLDALPLDELLPAVCRELRSRPTAHRADGPVTS